MSDLFGDDAGASGGGGRERALGRARLREPVRGEVRLEVVDLDGLLGDEHPARLIWAYVERLDFSGFEARVKSREGHCGMPRTSPRLLLALWLYATSDGVGSAREIARLSVSDPAYRWLCGGVGVNHHALSDFRSGPDGARVEDLLIEHVASLSSAGLIALDEVAQDGVKVRASAGAASFRRRPALETELARAKAALERLRRDEDDDPGSTGRKRRARRDSAARDRLARVEAALVALGEAEGLRARRQESNRTATEKQKEPRASTTDPQARVLKMPDGGFRPAYNVQFASLPESGVVIGVTVTAAGSDRGLAEPMACRIEAAFGRRPRWHLLDGGYLSAGDVEAAHKAGTEILSPLHRTKSGRDPREARAEDGPGVAAWRARMADPATAPRYKRRSRCELIHARLRNLGLDRPLVRGIAKVQAWISAFALASNIMAEARLRRAAAPA